MPKFSRRRYGRRRMFRRRRYGGKRYQRRRILRYALSRRPRPAEVKNIYRIINNTPIAPGISLTGALTPDQMAQGTDQGQRVGDEIFIRKVITRFIVEAPASAVGGTPSRYDGYYRLILWTPRIDAEQATQYMQDQMTLATVPDFHIVTVHKDLKVKLGIKTHPGFSAAGAVTGYFVSSNLPIQHLFVISLKFPRRARFGGSFVTNGDDMDVDKDILYYTLISSFPANAVAPTPPNLQDGNYQFETTMTYVDN